MQKIIKLDKILANQIAAGEVVERPFSVVKELVENSIDAGATKVKIEITEGGIDEIIITDNGEGIEKDDLSIVTQKYTTSKIKNLDDLYNIMTFGFRGEALASISSVSKFKIISKTDNSDFGYFLDVIDGIKSDISEYPCEKGTKIIVKNLFYNTPARLNYLKKPKTEYSYISDFLKQISLSYPSVGIELINDGKTVLKYKSGEDLKTRVYNIYGEGFFNNLLKIDFIMSGINISGYISDPKVSFGSNKKQALFVNNRIIKSPLIFKAIKDAYNRFIPHGQHSGYVLNIQINPTEVDVNVHPRKLEVRFANESTIFRGMYHAIQDKLNSVSLLKMNVSGQTQGTAPTDFGRGESCVHPDKSSTFYTGSGTKFKSYSPYKNTSPNPNQGLIKDSFGFSEKLLNNINSPLPLGRGVGGEGDLSITPLGKIIGQMHNSYIIVQTDNGLTILDQHALAERVIYEKLIKNSQQGGFSPLSQTTQGLLIGESIKLSQNEVDIVDKYITIFEEMGFEIEIMSSGILMINAIPDFIKKEKISNIIEGVIVDIGELGNKKSLTLEEVRNKIFAYTSCRSAIKFGHKLSLFEMNKLLNDSVLDYSATCPHGRPVVYDIDLMELQGKYER
ncbi:MAG: DNA mismatch repair endonuclease MutL [Candidatus Gracilibacteria bacterium]|nr:DNA mismatch repair endonuclease MutL [Candidatus Gracilibacteria bacterium]MDQ7023407.1 DNA mismatch repair endonuclease MutL [Candidatus Gracilibacteria bacterium]